VGRPYKNELRSLPDAYEWATTWSCDQLQQLWQDQSGKTLIASGSGGSYSAASSAVALHRNYHKSPGYAVTPLELEASVPKDQACSLWLFSGTGRNLDIRRALRCASIYEANELTVFCSRIDSPLEKDARKALVERIFSFDANIGKDGFLATNSLFVSTVILAASFESLPPSLATLIQSAFETDFTEEGLQEKLLSAANGRSNAIILHGPSGRAGALDLESKFTESALIASSVSDFRNFAHGRHNWINRFGAESLAVAFVGPGEQELARQTLELIPTHVPRVTLPLGANFAIAQVLSIYFSIRIAGWLGDLHGIDPGRPRIPEFGRRLYHLRARLAGTMARRSVQQTIIGRKANALGVTGDRHVSSSTWLKKYSTFRNRLNSSTIRAIVFDYDGTLVATKARFNSPIEAITERLVELLKGGIPIGIATGRGDSARQELQPIIPRELQARVMLGYHNASQIARLNVDREVDGDFLDPILEQFWKRLLRSPINTEGTAVRNYPLQISIRPSQIVQMTRLWTAVQALATEVADGKLKVMASGHSLDVIPKSVSKVALVSAISEEFAISESCVLRIGDSGQWPGNDCELLRSPLGLSVREVSADPETCWNLLPARCRDVSGTLYYLNRMQATDGVARIRL